MLPRIWCSIEHTKFSQQVPEAGHSTIDHKRHGLELQRAGGRGIATVTTDGMEELMAQMEWDGIASGTTKYRGGGGELVSEPGRDRWAQIAAHPRARPVAAPPPPRPAPPPPTRLANRCAAPQRPADRGPSAPGALPSAEARAGPDLGPAARGARPQPRASPGDSLCCWLQAGRRFVTAAGGSAGRQGGCRQATRAAQHRVWKSLLAEALYIPERLPVKKVHILSIVTVYLFARDCRLTRNKRPARLQDLAATRSAILLQGLTWLPLQRAPWTEFAPCD